MFRNKTARQHNFAVIPSAQFPRSTFRMKQTRKQAFDASDLIPIMCEEVLPGDTWRHQESVMARLATPIAPVLDDADLETFYFFVANRIVTTTDPGNTIQYNANAWENFITGSEALTIPLIQPVEDAATWPIAVGSVADHFGIPPGVYTLPLALTAFPFFAYFLIYNEWFRDQNLQDPWHFDGSYSNTTTTDDITQATVPWDTMPLRINKRSDYFTRSLPFAQKGNPITLPLGTTATVRTNATDLVTGAQNPMRILDDNGAPFAPGTLMGTGGIAGTEDEWWGLTTAAGITGTVNSAYPTNLYADLSTATAATINAIRLAAISQQLLERDARGGSRYVENLLAHWGVRSPDYRLYKPEYLGGGKYAVTNNPVAQTAAYDSEPAMSASAVGNLGAESHAGGSHRSFTYAATEHGYIIGLAALRATPTYQQGLRRHWGQRHTRLDFYDPLFAHLGEQAVWTGEIFLPLNTVPVVTTWGYQENAAEYRYTPNEITGLMRSTATQPLDWWHYAEEFATEPVLNDEFITDKTKETLARSLATAPSAQWSAQIIMDICHDSQVARLMPAYSVPGIDKF